MNGPTEKQARVLWFGLTALAVGVMAGLVGVLIWGLGVVVTALTPVLLPLAVAGIIAYLLDPVVNFFVKKRVPRMWSIFLVFALVIVLILGLFATVVPQIVSEGRELVDKAPDYSRAFSQRVSDWIAKSPWAQEVQKQTTQQGALENVPSVVSWLGGIFPVVSAWFLAQALKLASWVGLVLGLLLVPIYVFYFLLERDAIIRGWRDFLPISNAKLKEEVAFIISSINDSLIVFFRGQVLVSMCSGTLLVIGFLILGLNYALFLGALAGMLGIVPYLGAAISLIPAVTLAAVQFQDWWHPVFVLLIFGMVNALEGTVISPRIIGERVGLHPLTIIVAMMLGTTLLGGILGGLLAVPLTAALRSIMVRYVWKRGD